jgi:uncharacterized protein (TIGR03000 family)
MKEPTMRNALVVTVGLMMSAPASAQFYGPFYRPFGAYPYGYLGYFPGAYSSSWSNGFSLYGPPVPTYGSVPGAFGGADQRLNTNIQIYNGASIGLGRSGSGGAGPRMRHFYAGAGSGMAVNAPAMGQAAIEVRVPTENAEVFFENIPVQQQGRVRQFVSPSIQAGLTHYYKIRARWMADGQPQEQTRSVGVRANEKVIVDFNEPEAPRGTILGEG